MSAPAARTVRRLLPSCLAVCLWLLPLTLRGQTRPLLTEEATTAGAGSVVLEAGVDFIRDEPNFLTGLARDRWDAPVLRVVYAPAGNVELDLEWVGRVIARGDPDFGNVSDDGDVTLRAKVRFWEPRPGRPTLAARFGVTLPETSFGTGLGPNTLRMSAQALLSQSWAGFSVHLNAGLAIHDEPLRPHEQRDFLAWGVAASLGLGARASLVAEAAGRSGDGMPGAEERAELRAGVRYGTGRLRWDAALRRGLAEADGSWGFTAGLAWAVREGR
jgi:hypothetical protein